MRTIHASHVTWLWHHPYLVGNSAYSRTSEISLMVFPATDEGIQSLLMNEFSLVFSSKSNLCDGARVLAPFHDLTPTNIQTWIVALFATKHVLLVIILKGFAWPWLCLRGAAAFLLLLESPPAHSLWILRSAEKRSTFPAAFGYWAFTARIRGDQCNMWIQSNALLNSFLTPRLQALCVKFKPPLANITQGGIASHTSLLDQLPPCPLRTYSSGNSWEAKKLPYPY